MVPLVGNIYTIGTNLITNATIGKEIGVNGKMVMPLVFLEAAINRKYNISLTNISFMTNWQLPGRWTQRVRHLPEGPVCRAPTIF